MTAGDDWLGRVLGDTPEPLKGRLLAMTGDLPRDENLAGALLSMAREALESVRHRLGERDAAYDLLLADGLLTLACEAVAHSDPTSLVERCEAMGPGGELGRLAERWAGSA